MTKKFKRPTLANGKQVGLPKRLEIRIANEYPAFSLRYLDSKFCLTKCNREEKAAFADKVRILSQLSWIEIDSSDRYGHGYEPLESKRIKRPIPNHISPDTRFIAFRFSGMKPMVGYRDGNIFYVIWFDRDSTLYDHE